MTKFFQLTNRQLIHSKIYFGAIILLALSLPLSEFMMSISQFVLAGNWLLEGRFKQKFSILKNRKSIALIMSIFLIHIIWLLITNDFKYAFNDIRIKIPLLIIPLIIGTSEKLSFRQIKIVVIALSTALFISSMLSMSVVFGLYHKAVDSSRDISLFISHIRFSLLINVAIFSLSYFLFNSLQKKYEKYIYTVLILWFILFLLILKSFTGIFVLAAISIGVFIYFILQKVNNWFKVLFFLILLFGLGSIFNITYNIYSEFENVELPNYSALEKRTPDGSYYWHDTLNFQIENGQYAYVYLCEQELEKEWHKKSSFNYRGKDKKGHELKHTLIRYLTSLGLRKDAQGVLALKEDDVKAIENGTANYLFKNKFSIYARIYQIVWEFDVYKKGGNPSGHSLTQRIEFLKTATAIIKDNFWFGVGTGDIKKVFKSYYAKTNSILDEQWRLRAHNQFITFIVAFGVIGFMLIMIALLYPIYLEKGYKKYLFVVFFIIGLLSMLNEDTLETQAGVTFFIYFYTLFLFSSQNNLKEDN